MSKVKSQGCCPPESIEATGDVEIDLSTLCKALGHPARVRIVRTLIEKGTCISGDLAEVIDLAPSTASEHLRILKEAGFIQGSIDGLKRCYCVNPDVVKFMQNLLASL